MKREAAISSRTLRLQEEATRHTQEQLLMREAAFEGLKDHYEEHYQRKLKEEIATYVFAIVVRALSYPVHIYDW